MRDPFRGAEAARDRVGCWGSAVRNASGQSRCRGGSLSGVRKNARDGLERVFKLRENVPVVMARVRWEVAIV